MLKKREKRGKGRSEKQEKEYEVHKTSGTIPGAGNNMIGSSFYKHTKKRKHKKRVLFTLLRGSYVTLLPER